MAEPLLTYTAETTPSPLLAGQKGVLILNFKAPLESNEVFVEKIDIRIPDAEHKLTQYEILYRSDWEAKAPVGFVEAPAARLGPRDWEHTLKNPDPGLPFAGVKITLEVDRSTSYQGEITLEITEKSGHDPDRDHTWKDTWELTVVKAASEYYLTNFIATNAEPAPEIPNRVPCLAFNNGEDVWLSWNSNAEEHWLYFEGRPEEGIALKEQTTYKVEGGLKKTTTFTVKAVKGEKVLFDSLTAVVRNPETMRVVNDVGIGTPGPKRQLDIRANGKDVIPLSIGSGGDFWDSPGGKIALEFRNSDTDSYPDKKDRYVRVGALSEAGWGSRKSLYFETNGLERMRIRHDGNVGIGTGEPGARLEVRDAADNDTKDALKITGQNGENLFRVGKDGVVRGVANAYRQAQCTLSGGGIITWGGPGGRLKWTKRLIAIPVGNPWPTRNGYINIELPTTDIAAQYVHDNVARLANAEGVVLKAWEALYAVHTVGESPGEVSFRIVDHRVAFNAPSNWLLVAAVNGDDEMVKLGTGAILDYWHTPELLDEWRNWDIDKYNAAGFFKDSHGTVHLRGMMSTFPASSLIFVLPEGYRPARLEKHIVPSTGLAINHDPQIHGVLINENGRVTTRLVGSSYVSLDGITFRAAH